MGDKFTIIRLLLEEFHRRLDQLPDLIERDVSFPDAPKLIKVAIGMRKVGKTYFLYREILRLLKQGVSKEAILYLPLGDHRLFPLNHESRES